MKKLLLLTLLISLLALAITGCELLEGMKADKIPEGEHEHSGGTNTCSSGAICTVCGVEYGELTEHDYADATCETAKTCKLCGITYGKELGHSYVSAVCGSAKSCDRCGLTFGAPLEHSFNNATCTEPKTCKLCGVTEGAALDHSYVEATCDSAKKCERCHLTFGEPLEHDFTEASCTAPKTCKLCGMTEGSVKHSYNNVYTYNESAHWIECASCGDKKDVGTHVGGESDGASKAQCEICMAEYDKEPEIVINWKIEAKTPEENTTFCLANSRIKTWYESFDFRTTNTDEHKLDKDIFLPSAPLFTWTVGENANYYKLYLSTSEDMYGAQCYLTSSTELSVEHLYAATDYYWLVDAVYDGYTVRSEVFSFKTEASPRTVNIDGVSNSRDIGGYLTVDGKRIKQGMVYRSAKLDDITEVGKYTLLNLLGVKTDLDLRGDRNDYYKNATHPVAELNHIVVACPWYSSGDNHIWLDEYNMTEFAKAVKVFADPDNYPIIFHCSLGRDRTGTLAMVLEGLLGLDENTLMMEYELSVFSYWGSYGSSSFNTGHRNNIHNTYLYINDNYDGDTFSEKVEDFLLDIGVTAEEIASIKSIMLEEVE